MPIRGGNPCFLRSSSRCSTSIHKSSGSRHFFSKVRRCFQNRPSSEPGPLHILVNNAGVMASPEMRTPEGWEMQFATNHFGHFALATGLRRALAAAGEARVVSVSSGGHLISPVVFDDIHFRVRTYESWPAYGQSKTANALFAVEAIKRWADDGITVNALMPGAILWLAGCNFASHRACHACYLPSLYVVHFKGAPNSGEAQDVSTSLFIPLR
jgi:NAD(P)-dependent dehydrogenase (short-subunit alcohol dehydrogenase family)